MKEANNIKNINDCKTLEELYALWREAHKTEEDYKTTTINGIEQNAFIKDGYINKACYDKSKYKTLFILKEANMLNYGKSDDQMGFYINYIEGKEGANRPKQQEKIGRMAYYLINGENENAKTPSEAQLKNALKYSAFMNINKRGGAKNTNNKKFNAYYSKYEQFVKKEIEIINPECIVMIGTTGANCSICTFAAEKDIRIITMWHTAYRMSGQKRNDNPIYALPSNDKNPDKNVDCYMRKFFERAAENK